MSLIAVDVQGFAGGFTEGMRQAGFDVVAKRELPGGFGAASVLANFPGIQYQEGPYEAWEVVRGGAHVVFGNPPCSGFSTLTSRIAFGGVSRSRESPINHCMWAFAHFVARQRPYVAAFESVQLAYKRGIGLMRDLRAWLEEATGEKWELYHVLQNSLSLGGCARRRRYFWVVSRVPFGVTVPDPIPKLPTLRDAIGDLEHLPLRWEAQPYDDSPVSNHADRWLRNPAGVVDGHEPSPNASRRYLDLVQNYDWKQGQGGRALLKEIFESSGTLPELWHSNLAKYVNIDFAADAWVPYRWRYDEVARVVDGGTPVSTPHPTQPRMYTHREILRIQGFPDTWRIGELRNTRPLVAFWGKGIPVQAGYWLGEQVRNALLGQPGDFRGYELGEREHVVNMSYAYRGQVPTVMPQEELELVA
jgi:site-specific DNA-cytosine methylase